METGHSGRRAVSGLTAALALSLLASGCGKHESSQSSDPGDEAVKAQITADVETPFMLGLTSTISAEELDANGNLGQEAVLTTTAMKEDQAIVGCVPNTPFTLLPNGPWMAARVAQRIEGPVLIKQGGAYSVSAEFMKTSFVTRPHGEICPKWYFFDFGHFRITGIERVNEFTAPDPQTLANAKVRSYRVSATFVPSASLAAVARQAKYGTFTWIAAFEQDPVALSWKLYKFDHDIHLTP